MEVSTINQIYNWINEANKNGTKASEVVKEYNEFYSIFAKQKSSLLAHDLKEIEMAYSKTGGCRSCGSSVKNNEMVSKQNATNNKYYFVENSFNNYIKTCVEVLSKLTFERFKKQNFTLDEIYIFTSDNLKKPASKSWKAVFAEYENTKSN